MGKNFKTLHITAEMGVVNVLIEIRKKSPQTFIYNLFMSTVINIDGLKKNCESPILAGPLSKEISVTSKKALTRAVELHYRVPWALGRSLSGTVC